jgi:hydroxyacylglutathione hydrolase
VPSTTLGYEKLFNWAFSVRDEAEFVAGVLAGQPEPPRYFAEMKRINRDGPRVLGGTHAPPRLDAERLHTLAVDGALIVDTRRWAEFRIGAVPGTINIPLNRSFTTWAGWLIPYDRDFYLIAEPSRLVEAVRDLTMIGLDRVTGWFEAEAVEEVRRAGVPLVRLGEVTAAEARDRIAAGDVAVLDVRGASEWQAGHLPDVPNIPLGYLRERLAEVPTDQPVLLYCRSGSRSGIAASLLAAHGITNVMNLQGGINGWSAAGNPIEHDAEPIAAIH